MANGLLGMFQPQPDQLQTLLGEYYNPKTSRMKWLGGSLQGLGAGLASGRPGAWAEGLIAGGGPALDDYQREALLGYQMAQAAEDKAYGRERDTKADERWQEQFDYNRTRQNRADAQANTQFDWQMDDRQRQDDMRAGQQNAVEGFAQNFQSQGGDLFSPEMQMGLRQQGIAGVDPADTQKYNRMRPYMGAQDYGGAFQQMTAQPEKPDLPTSYEEYLLGQRDPAYAQSQIDQKKAGAPQTNIDMKQDSAFASEAGKGQATRLQRFVDDGDKAVEMIGNIEVLRDLGTQINTGKGAELMAAFGPWADYAGVSIDGLGEAQAYQAIISKIAPSLRTPGVGSSSDFDARQFLMSLPQLGTTPEGNAIIQNTLESVAQWKIQAAEISQAALSGQITPQQADAMIRELGDPWTMWREANKNASPAQDPNAPKIRRYNPQTGKIE